MEVLETSCGKPFPFGAQKTSDGVNFCIFSRNATKVTLNIYKQSQDTIPQYRIDLDSKINKTGDVWHILVKGISEGTLYTYQVDGPFDLIEGHRFNYNQILLDPYAKALTPVSVFKNLPKDYRVCLDKEDVDLSKDEHNFLFPKCVVIDDENFDWQGDKPINRPLSKTIIYETHLSGFTKNNNSGVKNKGTYDGFIEKIPYLKYLGINAVEFLPIFEFDENENNNINPKNGERLKNYWGYSTIQFFAPKANYCSTDVNGDCVREFKTVVRELHKNGIEVILDVVFNHTAEGNEHGVTLNFRGLENSVYYNLVQSHKEYYMNFSGCGNTINCNHPIVRQFIIECLQYWVLNYHIDGFRFDLASILSRSQEGALLKFPPLLNQISEDPILHNTKIIAEPWDAGGGYQLGCFPGGRWCEWNDRFRDDIRRFWRGDEFVSTGAATRISGSSDLYGPSLRTPCHSINYVTCHDGFTMNDLVSYNGKHNEENGENNRDGSDSNYSYNHGFEGATGNSYIEKVRTQTMKNFILTLLISQGTPMLLGGDEFRRGQKGNNNAYCQDNEISWFDWTNCDLNKDLVEFTRKAIILRKEHSVFRREQFFTGHNNSETPDIQWFNKDSSNPDWNRISRFLAFKLGGNHCVNEDGNKDFDFYIACNTDRTDSMVTLPTLSGGKKWYRVADTSIEGESSILLVENAENLRAQERYVVVSNSMIILVAK